MNNRFLTGTFPSDEMPPLRELLRIQPRRPLARPPHSGSEYKRRLRAGEQVMLKAGQSDVAKGAAAPHVVVRGDTA